MIASPTSSGAAGEPAAGASLLALCTGNASRSVMVGFMLENLSARRGLRLRVRTAGTHALSGQPMGLRTRAAIATIPELADVPVSRHRSHQLLDGDLHDTDLVVAMEADHVRYVRRIHPAAAPRTATIRWLAAHLTPGPGPLAGRVRAMALDTVDFDDADDVVDPAGRDDDVYRACALELWSLTGQLVDRL
jgi:protein-tyrosine-phosphatase